MTIPDSPSLNDYKRWIDSNHSTFYPLWSEEEKANPKLAKARLWVELGLTESTPDLLTPFWEKAINLGFSEEALKSLTIISNHEAATESWIRDFKWEFKSKKEPFVPDIPSQTDKILYNKKDPHHPPLEGLEKELLLSDADKVLGVFLKHGFWDNPNLTLFVPDLWDAPYQGMPWWSTALALNAQKCAELAYPDLLKKASQEQLDQALMVVWLSQLNALEASFPKKSTLENQDIPSMSPQNALKWTKRLLDLGANPYCLLKIDSKFDEMIYADKVVDYAPREGGVEDHQNPYCVAHLALYLSVQADRYDSFKDLTSEMLPLLDVKQIPMDAWGRDVASVVLLSSDNLFYKPQSFSTYQGENALSWLQSCTQEWGRDDSVERGWNPAITLWRFGLKKEYARTFLLENAWFEKIHMPVISWKTFQSELRSYAFNNISFVPTFDQDGKLKSWAYEEGGILEAITPCLEESIRIPWMDAIALTRDKMLHAFSDEKQHDSFRRDPEMAQKIKMEQSTAIDAHKLNWEVFRNTEDHTKVTSSSKLRL